jgi:hypothetical protein
MRSMLNVKAGPLIKAVASLALVTLCGCEADLRSPNNGIGELEFPSRADFPPVADAMQARCGTLDCHGQIGRNMRVFGRLGLRLPGEGGDPMSPLTTDEEYTASYLSVTNLEPETMSKVVKNELSPVQLAFVRKPRELEKHKGLQLMTKGDPLDRCLVGWLTGTPDPDACTQVILTPKPEPDGGQ